MTSIKINGGNSLNGKVKMSGSKNSVLPILAATILTDEKIVLKNVPDLEDVRVMVQIMTNLGMICEYSGNILTIQSGGTLKNNVPYDLVRKMRASFNVLGPLSVRNDEAKVPLPGGCNLGPRPVDIHLDGLKALGFETKMLHGVVNTKRVSKIKEAKFSLKFPSIGATQQLLTTAVLLEGTRTELNNVALEPEIDQLIEFLSLLGAKITRKEGNTLIVNGTKRLSGTEFDIIPDRIETGTFVIAAAATKGDVEITGCVPRHNIMLLDILKNSGISVNYDENNILVKTKNRPLGTNITGQVYPGFPTDLLPLATTLYSTCVGETVVKDEVFPERLSHVWELQRMNAKIEFKNNSLFIAGIDVLSAAPVVATDLRCSSALIIAGLNAEGTTIVNNIDSLFRGYENFGVKLKSLGASIEFYENGER